MASTWTMSVAIHQGIHPVRKRGRGEKGGLDREAVVELIANFICSKNVGTVGPTFGVPSPESRPVPLTGHIGCSASQCCPVRRMGMEYRSGACASFSEQLRTAKLPSTEQYSTVLCSLCSCEVDVRA